MEAVSDLLELSKTLFYNWVFWATGLVGLLTTIIEKWSHREGGPQKSFSWMQFRRILAFCLVLAFPKAWLDLRQKVRDLEAQKAHLEAQTAHLFAELATIRSSRVVPAKINNSTNGDRSPIFTNLNHSSVVFGPRSAAVPSAKEP